MTHYHLLITAGRELDDTSRFYKLGVGTTTQANRDYLYVLAWALSHNYYFRIYDVESIDFIQRIAHSLAPTPKNVPAALNLQSMKIRDFVRIIKAETAIPLSQSSLDSRNNLLNHLNNNYFIRNGKRNNQAQ